jgi:HSP20 family protein
MVRKKGVSMPVQELMPRSIEPFSLLRRDLDSLFESFWRTNGWPTAEMRASLFPTVNISDDVEFLRVTADLPGLERKDVTVALEEDRLVLCGSRSEEKEEKGRTWVRRERTSGEFRREIEIPFEIDAAKAVAAMHNGVLTVSLPKRPEAMQKRRVLEIKQV